MNKVLPLLLLIGILLISCSQDEGSKEKPIERTDEAFKIFNEAKTVAGLDEKLQLLSMAAEEINRPEDTLLIDIIDFQIYYYDVKKSFDSSLYYAQLMIENGMQSGDTASIAKGYYRKSKTYFYQGAHEQVLKTAYQAQRLYRSIGDSVMVGRRLVELANAQDRLGDFTGSHQSATEALIFLPSKDSVYKVSALNLIGLTSSKLKDFEESIQEYKNALKYAGTLKDSLIIYNNIALNYKSLKDYKVADSVLSFSLRKVEKGSPLGLRIADNYYYNQFLKSDTNVIPALIEIAEQRKQVEDFEGLLSSYSHLISVYKEIDPSQAKKFAQAYLKAARDFGNPVEKLEALERLISLGSSSAEESYEVEYFKLNDSIISARNRIKNLFAKIKYNEEQKLEEIDELENLSSRQKLEILQERNRRNFAILFGFLLLAAALFVYHYLRQRHKKETIREIHDTEARISKKIHDELANDVFNVMTELENLQAVNPEVTLNKLESIYERTRNISRENTSITTGPEYKKDLHYMLSRNTPKNINLYLVGFQNIFWVNYEKEARIVIFRVLQELMINMKKHSNASMVSLNFRQNSSNLQISYNDNGVGISSGDVKVGSGIQNMESRIASLGGSFKFQPVKKGLSVQIQIPV